MFDEIGSRNPATAEAIKMLIEAKALHPDAGVEQFVRNLHGLPAADPSTAPGPAPREIVEMVQKVYSGVGKVITSQEARDLLNQAGAGLAEDLPEGLVPPTDAERASPPPAGAA